MKKDQILRRQINKRLQTLVNQTNMDLLEMFKSKGINYVPFKLIYNEYEVLTDQGSRRPVKNVTLDIDPDFLEKLFEDKIGFQTWLSRHHPQIAREHWKAVNLGHKEPNINKYIRKFHKEEGDNVKPNVIKGKTKTKGGRINQKKSTIVAYVREKANPEDPTQRMFQSFTGRDVEKFMENEEFIFKGNLKTYFKNTPDKRVEKVLKDALTKFNDLFQKMPLNLEQSPDKEKLSYQEFLAEKHSGEKKETDMHKSTIRHEKFLSEIDGMKQQWRVQPKFPNIRNIRDWFIRTGIYNSYKLDQFNNIKTVKGRMNWIDRSVFLIANGVYANSLGQRTASWSGKYKQSVGAKIPLSKARKAKRFKNKNLYTNPEKRNKYRTERQIKYEQWNIDNRKIAAGWKNSGAVYSRVNRKSGNSRAQADSRKDNRQ
jgi:hypothetical protein|tara:strand:+ start:77 stop:1357 length:1281 start_codon:yes stop_codon:yes gene_type:complete